MLVNFLSLNIIAEFMPGAQLLYLLRSGRRDWKLSHPVFPTAHRPRCHLLEGFYHFTLESPFLTHNSIAVFVSRFYFD